MLPPAPGKTFWCQLGQAERVQKSYRPGLEGWILTKCRECPDFQTTVRQQVTQMPCDTGAAHKILAKKNDGNVLLQNLIIVWYMQGILLKTNKQASKQASQFLSGTTSSVCQTPSSSLSLPWESFRSHEWWLKASSRKQLSELSGWL